MRCKNVINCLKKQLPLYTAFALITLTVVYLATRSHIQHIGWPFAAHDSTTHMRVDVDKARIVQLHFPRTYANKAIARLRPFGDGLRRAVAGEQAEFFIDLSQLPLQDRQLGFKNMELYVWFEGDGVVFSPDAIQTINATTVVVRYTAADPGAYAAHIEVLEYAHTQHRVVRVEGSPWRLRVVPPRGSATMAGNVSFLRWPTAHCTDAAWRQGRWVACQRWQPQCTRTGWMWVPHECTHELLDLPSLTRLREPLWVVIAGTSVIRGMFLSIVDGVLKERAANLTESEFWKCWGWMDLTVGNLRVSYLDLRESSMWTLGGTKGVEREYLAHAAAALAGLARENSGRGPDAFVLGVTPETFTKPNAIDSVATVKSFLGVGWRGRFVVVPEPPRLFLGPGILPDAAPPQLFVGVERFARQLGIENVDVRHMALPFMHTMESSFFGQQHQQHYHRRCKVGTVHSCSPVMDMAAQMVLDALLSCRAGPLFVVPAEQEEIMPMRFCLQCPPNLVPFTIHARHDKVQCLNHLPASHNS